MKLLASLLGCAVADYACCPYDEFGVVNPACPLSEKTPWAMDGSNADPAGVEVHVCKAWEANIDATMEGTDGKADWGGCGFQRHFPWSMNQAPNTNLGAASAMGTGTGTPASFLHCTLGVVDCTDATGTVTKAYESLRLTATSEFDFDEGPFSDSGANMVFGNPHLGGVCKLWIPVRHHMIDSVSVAGVHMNGGGTAGDGIAGGNAKGSMAVFDNAMVMGTEGTVGTDSVGGTAYCFSVVNVAEFMKNTNDIVNANVAGGDPNSGAPHELVGTISEEAPRKQFGESLAGGANHHSGTGIVEAGASFDVVVHFKSEWCIRHWTIQDMQIADDVNSGVDDYDLYGDPPRHAHTDVADKRFPQVGICGCCNEDVATTNLEQRLDDPALAPTDPTAFGCKPCVARTGATASCVETNTYAESTFPSSHMWPNAGAWAGFYSFITCADAGFMIYDRYASYDLTTHAWTGGTGSMGRSAVHSMFYNDIRHEHEGDHKNIHIRGNIRQVGADVKVCGPGQVLETNQRCTWNWNFRGDGGATSRPQQWMHADVPTFEVWDGGAAQDRNTEAQAFDLTSYITEVTQNHVFTIHFQNNADAGPNDGEDANDELTFDAAKYFNVDSETIDATSHRYEFTMKCLKADGTDIADGGTFSDLGDDANSNVRDKFPDCYMGDEIHFEYKITDSARAQNEQQISAWYSWVDTPSSFHA